MIWQLYSETHLAPEVLWLKIEYWFNFNFGDKLFTDKVDGENVPLSFFVRFVDTTLNYPVWSNLIIPQVFTLETSGLELQKEGVKWSHHDIQAVWSLMVLALIFSVDLVSDTIMRGNSSSAIKKVTLRITNPVETKVMLQSRRKNWSTKCVFVVNPSGVGNFCAS